MSTPTADILKMNKGETMKFLELYKGERLLWDPTMIDNKCRRKRTAAAERIAGAMKMNNFTEMHVIQKFKNLRSSYCQELKRIAYSTENASSPENIYVPKVVWFKLMDSFLRPYVKSRSDPNSDASEKYDHTDYTLDNEEYQKSIPLQPVFKEEVEIYEDNYLPLQKRTKRSNSQIENHTTSYDENSEDISKNDDSFDHFGRYIASTLRNMPRKTALQVQGGIMTLLIKSQMEIESGK